MAGPVRATPLKGALLGLAAFALYSAADAAIKSLGSSYSAVQILAFAGLFFLPLIFGLWLRARVALRPVYPGLMALRTLAVTCNGLVVTYAFTRLPLAQAYTIFFTMPLLLTLFAWPLLGERFGARGGFAVLLGLAGVIVALNPGQAEHGTGHLAALAGTVLAALNHLLIRKTGGAEAMVPMMLYPVLGQTLTAFVLLPGAYVPMPVQDLAVFAVLALGGFFGSLLIIAAYRAAPAIVVAPMQYSQIVWAAIFGALFFGEAMSPRMVLGMILIGLAGVLVVERKGSRKRNENQADAA